MHYCISAKMIFNCSSHPWLPISTSYSVTTPACWYQSRLRTTEVCRHTLLTNSPSLSGITCYTPPCQRQCTDLSAWVNHLPLMLLWTSNAPVSLTFSCPHWEHWEFKIQLRHYLFSAAFPDPLRGGIPSLCFYSTLKNFFYNIYSNYISWGFLFALAHRKWIF